MNATLAEDYFSVKANIVAADLLAEGGDLTQQEIDEGLRKLQISLQRKRLPFVILVEDDDLEAHLFRRALHEAGAAVEFMHFRNGRQAEDFFQGNNDFSDRDMFPLPNLTVLDLKLVNGSGLKILEQIRSKPSLEKLVVVALTSSQDKNEIEQARLLRINDWINKPQVLSELVEIVRHLTRTWLNTE